MDGHSWGELPHLLPKSLHRELGRWKNCVVCWGTSIQRIFLDLPAEEANISMGMLLGWHEEDLRGGLRSKA